MKVFLPFLALIELVTSTAFSEDILHYAGFANAVGHFSVIRMEIMLCPDNRATFIWDAYSESSVSLPREFLEGQVEARYLVEDGSEDYSMISLGVDEDDSIQQALRALKLETPLRFKRKPDGKHLVSAWSLPGKSLVLDYVSMYPQSVFQLREYRGSVKYPDHPLFGLQLSFTPKEGNICDITLQTVISGENVSIACNDIPFTVKRVKIEMFMYRATIKGDCVSDMIAQLNAKLPEQAQLESLPIMLRKYKYEKAVQAGGAFATVPLFLQ